MKMDDVRKNIMTTRTTSNLIVAFLSILFFFLVSNITYVKDAIGTVISVLTPFILGFAIAYLLNPLLKFFERLFGRIKVFAKKPRLNRGVSLGVTYLIAILLVGLLIAVIVPQVADSLVSIVQSIPDSLRSLKEWVTTAINNPDIVSSLTGQIESMMQDVQNVVTTSVSILNQLVPGVIDVTMSITGALINIFAGLIASIYFLLSKEKFIAQTKKFLYANFRKERVNRLIDLSNESNQVFGGFISGKLLDAAIIGILCFIFTSIIGMPYAMLVSVIIGITNIIPFFGPFIGAIPSTLLILMIDPIKALIFVIFIIVLQQVDGNIIGPKILGETTGISGFWVLFSIILGGGLFGFMGMLLGVPTFAVIYSLVREFINARLSKKSLPVETENYTEKNHPIE